MTKESATLFARLQSWLQGPRGEPRSWVAIALGNAISEVRYRWWRLRGGRWENE